MKKLFAFAVSVGIVLTPMLARAEAMAGMEHEAAAVVEVGNKICPVSKENIGEMGKAEHIEYKGKNYNLCCPMCKKDFNKDPEKFSKVADDEVMASMEETEKMEKTEEKN